MALFNGWNLQAQQASPAQQMQPTVIPRVQFTAPSALPVTAAELADELKVSGQDEAAYLTRLLTAATSWVEAWTGRWLMTRTGTLWLDFFPPENQIEVGPSPVTAIATVSSFDDDDTETELSATTDYRIDLIGEPARIVLRKGVQAPSGLRNVNAIKVTFTAGYADAAAVPEGIKSAIRLIATEIYLNRGAQVDAGNREALANYMAPDDALLLLQPFKVVR